MIASPLLILLIVAYSYGACPTMVNRKDWKARSPKGQTKLSTPASHVVIHHTYSPGACTTTAQCSASMRGMQKYHQDNKGWADVGYNFCIGGDGKVYEGRGWNHVGAHTIGYNTKAIGICFIGDFTKKVPSAAMLEAGKKLIRCGVSKGKIKSRYTLLGHRQAGSTECPGGAFYKEIKKWPRWTSKP